MKKVKLKLNNAKLWATKWLKRAIVAGIILAIAYAGLYAYWDWKIDQILPEKQATNTQSERPEVSWRVLRQVDKRITRNPTTKFHADLIINYAKDSPVAWYDLLAIAAHESLLWDMTGDRGCSQGLFHINWCTNTDMEKNEALNALTALAWTESKLLNRGYPSERFTAIGKHNGGDYANKVYAFDVLRTANKLKQASK